MQMHSARGAASRARWLAAICCAALLTDACAWYSFIPKEKPGPLPETGPRTLDTLALGEPREGVLDCSRKQCNQWYRLDVPTPGSLDVRVETHQQGERPMTRLVVRQIGRDPLGQTMGGTSNVLSVRDCNVNIRITFDELAEEKLTFLAS